ncbi:hypothetical protein HYR99_08665 [Candidatus Poribacteria bacterium]|nr:hypothetical protein [Candidatus Poribacteria bacterium]
MFALFLIILPVPGFASDTFRISGYYKNFFTVFDSPEPKTPEPTLSEPVPPVHGGDRRILSGSPPRTGGAGQSATDCD